MFLHAKLVYRVPMFQLCERSFTKADFVKIVRRMHICQHKHALEIDSLEEHANVPWRAYATKSEDQASAAQPADSDVFVFSADNIICMSSAAPSDISLECTTLRA